MFVLLAAVAFFSFFWAHEERLTWFDVRPVLAAAAKYDATVIRDRFGVPHITGARDADAAFGLGYAHAEDDFATIQRAFLAARGRLATLDGVGAAENDYFVQLLGIWDAIAARYDNDLSPETRALLDGYSAGVNLYAAQHRGQVLPGFEPVRGQDIVALFMLRLPLTYGLDGQLRALIAGGTSKVLPDPTKARGVALAVAPARSADGATRLLINPQGPFKGGLAWYEAQVTSGQGWNLTGGLFPGSPVMIAGAGPNQGWAMTPNHPDLVDVYALEGNPNDRYFYRFDGDWRRLESHEARVVTRLWGPVRITFRREVLRSVHGPVIRNARGLFAVHYAGQDDIRAIEAFFHLNKAQTFDAFNAALAEGAIPSFAFVYADRAGRIESLYNAMFPARSDGYDWTRTVPGNISDDLWTNYLAATSTPRAGAPASGFVLAAGATPFRMTLDPFNPKPESFPPSQGLEVSLNNRTRRLLALLSADRAITADKFRSYKFDTCYTADSDFAVLVKDLAQRNFAGDPLLEEAGEILRRYDLCTNKNSRGAPLALMAAVPLLQASAAGRPRPDAITNLRGAANRLLAAFGRLDPTWGEVNRLRRGSLELPLSGGPDALRNMDVRTRLDTDGKSIAEGGDNLVMLSTWLRDGRWQIESVVPYGSSQMTDSRHYADQAELYADNKLKTVPLTPTDIMAEASQIERPGRPAPRQPAPVPPSPNVARSTAAIGVTRPAAAAERNGAPRAVTR
jgi:penicillin amidase/acyl-homoserine-lactone acylase